MTPSLLRYLLTGQVIQPSVSNITISYVLSGFNSALHYFHILVQFKICLGFVLNNHTTYPTSWLTLSKHFCCIA